jgi:T1SS-143 domain-containing protein
VVINADGTYTYTLDNTNLTVQGLTTGEHLTDTFSYTIKDADGDVSTTTLSITINGADDGVTLSIPNDTTGTHNDVLDQVVYESGLASGSSPDGTNTVVNSHFTLSALDGLNTIDLTAGTTTTTLTAVQIQALDATHTQTITTANGTLVLNSYSQASDGTITIGYSYTLNTAPTVSGTDTTDTIAIKAYDKDSDTDTQNLVIKIVDDVPIAHNNHASVVEGASSAITGNVITDTDGTEGKDVVGADGATVHAFTYTDGSGASQTITFADANPQTVTTKDGSLTVNPNGTWSFTPNGSVSQPTDSTKGSFSYTLIDGDGDISAPATHTITVTDTNPSAIASNGTLNENDLATGSTPTPADLTITQGVTITVAQDTISNVTFDTTTKTSLEALNLTSGGQVIGYTLSGDGHMVTATKGAGGAEVFSITLTNPDSSSAGYDFKLSLPIDHTIATGHDTDWILPFSVTTTDADGSTASGNFTVDVKDSVPTPTNQTVTGSEDTSLIIRLSQDVFSGDGDIMIDNHDGNGSRSVANGGTINILDPNDSNITIGTLLNNGDGTVTFTPVNNYSNSGSTLPSFGYDITDSDGDHATATVNIAVTPVADAPTFGSDNTTDHSDYSVNATGGLYRIYTLEDTAVALGLKAPVVSDTSGSDGSHAERLSIIKMDGFPAGSQLQYGDGTPVLAFNNAAASSSSGPNDIARIWLSDATNHINSQRTCPSDAVSMNTAQFEALKILPPAQSGVNFDVQAYVKEYEVDSNGNPLSGVASVQHLDVIKVKVLAVTDPITLSENSSTNDGDTTDGIIHKTINEDTPFDLKALLEASFNDLDGTEHRWITITNPNGNGDIIINGTTIHGGESHD